MAKDYSDVLDLETARRLLIAYDETTRKCVDEIERLRIHYDGTIMYGNRLVDLIEWAEINGINFPTKIYNPCVIAFEHFRNERERLKDSE